MSTADDEITSIVCRACGQIVAGNDDRCICGADIAPQQQRASRLTSAKNFIELAVDLVSRLEARGETRADALASEGSVIAEGFREWSTAMPEQSERSRQIQKLSDWSMKANVLLTEPRQSNTRYSEIHPDVRQRR